MKMVILRRVQTIVRLHVWETSPDTNLSSRQILAACRSEETTSWPGAHSFTKKLTEALNFLSNDRFSVSILQMDLTSRLDGDHDDDLGRWVRTPQKCQLGVNGDIWLQNVSSAAKYGSVRA